jgi:hypothetical protein
VNTREICPSASESVPTLVESTNSVTANFSVAPQKGDSMRNFTLATVCGGDCVVTSPQAAADVTARRKKSRFIVSASAIFACKFHRVRVGRFVSGNGVAFVCCSCYVSLPVPKVNGYSKWRREVPCGPRGPLRVSGQKIIKKFRRALDETETRKVCWEATAESGQLNELFDN